MLTVEHVTKRFKSNVVIEDATLAFSTGVTGLIAPNGAGKSTLLKMLATLTFPTEGRICWNGEDIHAMGEPSSSLSDGTPCWNGEDIHAMGERYRAMLGYLPQQFGYYPSYTPRAFLRYVGALQRMGKHDIARRCDELLELVGLADAADRRMREFSGGMVQRIGIATALLADPQILILDEPTAGLDPRERVRFRNIIHELAKERTVILSTHIVSDIEAIAGQIVFIQNGRVQAYPGSAELCAELAGTIFEVPVHAELPRGCQVLGERERDGRTMLRICATRCPEGARAVSPTLEDAFLVRYREGR